ncbi:MAG: hypothetical protein GX780_06890 [Campylobacteraceae bacterium]|nr:hypothetical protein [Campylobacteraceae bacterium]
MKKIISTILCIGLLFLSGCDSKEESKRPYSEPKTEKVADGTPLITVHSSGTEIKEDDLLESYDVEGRRQVRISPDGIETPLTKQIGAIVSIKNQHEQLSAKLLAQRLSKNYMLKCSACHDDYANGVIGPSLLMKSADDIFNMIEAYKHETEVNVLMKYLVMQMGEDEIRALAEEIAEFNKEIRESLQ